MAVSANASSTSCNDAQPMKRKPRFCAAVHAAVPSATAPGYFQPSAVEMRQGRQATEMAEAGTRAGDGSIGRLEAVS